MLYVGKNEYGFAIYICETIEKNEMSKEQFDELQKKYAEQICFRWDDVNELGRSWVKEILADGSCGMPGSRNDSAVDLLIAMQLAAYPEQLGVKDVSDIAHTWQEDKKASDGERRQFEDHLSRVFEYVDSWAFRICYDDPRDIERSVDEEAKTETYKVTFDSPYLVTMGYAMAPDPIGLISYALGNIGGAGCPSVQAIGRCLSDDDAGRITLHTVKRAFAEEQERKEASKTTSDIMKKNLAAEQREKENE